MYQRSIVHSGEAEGGVEILQRAAVCAERESESRVLVLLSELLKMKHSRTTQAFLSQKQQKAHLPRLS